MADNFASIHITKFLELADQASSCVIDVRSESEYAQGHIPLAISLPLLNDSQRHEVGLCYKTKGQQAAIELGFKLVGPLFYEKIMHAKGLAERQPLLIYCWRGGLRSNIMAWLLSTAGHTVYLLQGGYKSYRKTVNEILSSNRKYLCLTGKTGTGKTEILESLSQHYIGVLNLEKLARHRGSAFGGIGQGEQPTQEQFENDIAEVLRTIPNDYSVWFENESRMIGKVRIPDALFDHLSNSASIELTMDRSLRLKRILQEYSVLDKNTLIEKTKTLQKRMGPEQTKDAALFLAADNYPAWADILLAYYDKTYDYHAEREQRKPFKSILHTGDNLDEIVQTLLILATDGDDQFITY